MDLQKPMSAAVTRMRQHYPGRVPLVATTTSSVSATTTTSFKFLAPEELQVSQFLYVLRKRMQVNANEALFLFCEGRVLSGNLTLLELDHTCRGSDGLVHVTVSTENTFGAGDTTAAAMVLIVTLVMVLYLAHHFINHVSMRVFDSGVPGPTLLVLAGTHGTETGPSDVLSTYEPSTTLTHGRLLIIDRVSPLACLLGTRLTLGVDVNRAYPHPDVNGNVCTHPLAQQVLDLCRDADVVVDLHEAYGVHYEPPAPECTSTTPRSTTPRSMGSAVWPGQTPQAQAVAARLCQRLNNLSLTSVPFVVGSWSPSSDEQPTLRNVCNTEAIPYVLIELTGQLESRSRAERHELTRVILAEMQDIVFGRALFM